MDFEVQATEADPGELTVEKEIGEFELHNDDGKVQQFAEVVFVWNGNTDSSITISLSQI